MVRVVRSASAAFAIWSMCGAPASGQSMLRFDYGELRGVFTCERPERGGTLAAAAASEPGFLSAGSVTRAARPAGEALFDTGFVAEPNPADVVITLTFSPIRGGRSSAEGTVFLTDVDGDTIALWIAGTMSFVNNSEVLCAMSVTDIAARSDEGLFDGTDGGGVSLADVSDARGHVNIAFRLSLTRPSSGPVIVATAWTGALSGLRAVPGPSSGAMLALAALTFSARRRTRRWA